ncbi:MAG TPA: DUF6531 domain-containing protein [Thermoleophilaceae bacterium]|nr:DUF6531 domain-containing protein [Thermoleophilaceae bacterium]
MTYRADGWKYKQVAHGGLPGFEAPGYDDSAFLTGGAPFGGGGACPLTSLARTAWAVNTDMLLRRTVNISAPSGSIAITVTVDNDVEVFWNGTLMGAPPNKEGCAGYDDHQFEVPVSLQLSSNVLAIRAKDRGFATFIDVAVYPLALGATPAERWPAGWDPNQANPTDSSPDPVNTLTGAFSTSATDLTLPGRGLPFAFRRDYSSARTATGPFGPGWVHAYDARLNFEPDGTALFHAESGAIIPFFPDGVGGFYPAAGVLSKLTPVGGAYTLTRTDQVTYHFDATGVLLTISDRNSNQLSLTYTSGRLSRITDTVGRFVDLTYDPSGRLTGLAGPPSRSVTYGYDPNGRLSTVTDTRGKVTTYTYDPSGRLETVVDPNNHTVVTNEYGPDGRVVGQTDARGKHSIFAWDPVTERSTFTDANGGQWIDDYANGLLVTKIDPLGHTTSYTYDAAFQLTSTTDGRSNTTFTTYNRRGSLLSRRAPAPLNYLETYGYTDRNDPSTMIDGRNNQTFYGQDAQGNLIEVNGPGTYNWAYGRDPAGTGLLFSTTDPRGKITTYGYDVQANQNLTTTPLGFKTSMTYDPAGRMLTMVEPRGNVVGGDPLLYTTTYTYDPADRLLTTTDPLANLTTQTYDDAGNLETVTDANNHTTTYAYDEANNLASVTDARNGITAYAYDDVGNLASRTDANLHVTSYVYDLANRLSTTTIPGNRTWTLGYDNANNVTSRTDANGLVTTYTYDALNRQTGVAHGDFPITTDATFAQDPNGNLTSVVDNFGADTYTYDAVNRLTAVTRNTPADTFSYGYDAASNLISRTYPGQTAQTLAYDNDGRLTSASGATYTYDAAANLLTAATPDGFTARYNWDRAGRLLEVAHTRSTGTLSRFTYALDAVGNRTAMTTRQVTVTYRYDELDRLTEACWSPSSCPGGPPAAPLACLNCIGGLLTRPAATTNPPPGETFRQYTYDPVGNRLTEVANAGTTTYANDIADRLTSVTVPGGGVTNYTYDPNGNQLTAGARTFTYDRENRLKTATIGSTTETYTYFGDGTRRSASTGSQANKTTRFIWDRNLALPQVALERNGSDSLLRSYAYGLDLVSQKAGTKTYYYHHDGLGSVVDITGNTGTSLIWEEYYPYGLVRQGGSGTGAPVNPFNFTGEQLDAVTGFYHLRARQYDAGIGRFITTDPLAASIGVPYVATYAYVRNNPCGFVDPAGLTRDKNELAPDAEIDLSGLVPCDPIKLGAGLAQDILGGAAIAAAIVTAEFVPLALAEAAFGLYHIYEGQSNIYEAYHCDEEFHF